MEQVYLKLKSAYKNVVKRSTSSPTTKEELMSRLRWLRIGEPNGIQSNWQAVESIRGGQSSEEFWCSTAVSFEVFNKTVMALVMVHNDHPKIRITASDIAQRYRCRL